MAEMGLETIIVPDREAELRAALTDLHTLVVNWDTGESKVFLAPVDTRIAPDYYVLVKNPIDLSAIGAKIADGTYKQAWHYMEDMWLMFDNCFSFNRIGSFHHRYCQRLVELWEPLMERLMTVTLASHGYCCGRRRLLSGISYRCRASTCFVRYGSTYWQHDVEGGEEVIFCHTHYLKLGAEVTVQKFTNGTGGEIKFPKTALARKRHNTPLQPEKLVTCDTCARPDHEICVLHDPQCGKAYRCKGCRVATGAEPPPPVSVDQMPHCHLSECIEKEVQLVQRQWLANPRPPEPIVTSALPSVVPSPITLTSPGGGGLGTSGEAPAPLPSPGLGLGILDSSLDPGSVPTTPLKRLQSVDELFLDLSTHAIQIRVADVVADKCEVKANLRAHLPDAPSEYPYVRRIVLAFVNIDNIPVTFFGLIAQEYGAECPLPNRNCVYISLLDSMKLPKTSLPTSLRTAIYHAIVRSYLRVMGQFGFATAHIYTCPPRRGQNYIFPFKPDHQREISLTRLRQWYADLLNYAASGPDPAIVGYQTISDAYPNATLLQVPYFDGDNWPDIIEDILKVDDKPVVEERKQPPTVKYAVDDAYIQAIKDAEPHLVATCVKPRDAGGFYEGFPPLTDDTTPRKRRKVQIGRQAKPKLSPDARLVNLMASIKKDFLVVKLKQHEPPLVVRDPPMPSMGEEHSVISFLKTERLEFSSLRHAKFTTVVLIRYLLSEPKVLLNRFPRPLAPMAIPAEPALDETKGPTKASAAGTTAAASAAVFAATVSTPTKLTSDVPLSLVDDAQPSSFSTTAAALAAAATTPAPAPAPAPTSVLSPTPVAVPGAGLSAADAGPVAMDADGHDEVSPSHGSSGVVSAGTVLLREQADLDLSPATTTCPSPTHTTTATVTATATAITTNGMDTVVADASPGELPALRPNPSADPASTPTPMAVDPPPPPPPPARVAVDVGK